MRGAQITGWGMDLPDKVVTNADYEARLDTSDEWIVERTGIKERRHGGTTSGLAVEAARHALERAGRRGPEIDLLVLATTTPDQTVPATSSWVHHTLGCRGAAFDLNAACAGFVYGLVTAVALLDAGHERALLIGSDTLSQITDQNDRGTAVLFGDGAGAIVVEATEGEPLILAHDLGLDGSLTPILYCDRGGYIYMEGREVFRKAVRATVESAQPRPQAGRRDRRRDRPVRPPPGQHAHHRRHGPAPRHRSRAVRDRPRPHRQHLGRLLRYRSLRGCRRRAAQGRGPHLVLGIRGRDDMGQRRRAMGRGPLPPMPATGEPG